MKTTLNNLKPAWFLITGILAISLAHMTYSISIFAWFSNVPFLIYLSISKGLKSRLLFVISLMLAWSIVVLKIISPPVPLLLVFLFSIPISLIHLPAYLLWDKFRSRKLALFLFPSIITVAEWVQYSFTPFASWGVMAYSQLNTISIMQLASLSGMAGLSFLIYWVNASIADIINTKKISLQTFYLPIVFSLLAIIYGSLRVEIAGSKGYKTLTVAAVGTESNVSGLPLPSKESNEKVINDLLRKTKQAGSSGARLVVWNEASFYTLPENEHNVIESIKTLAKELGVAIVAAYVKPVSENPLKYENKISFISSKGEVEYSYLKHHPVPGEPAIPGTEKLKTVQVSESKIGAAICYDYDFPKISGNYGKLNADIVALPSSDWRGIDPLHTQMAAFRAVEQGHSVIRSTRFGLSAAISPYGELIHRASSYDQNSKILIADIPSKGIKTIYSKTGDAFIFICIGFIIYFLSQAYLKKKPNHGLNPRVRHDCLF